MAGDGGRLSPDTRQVQGALKGTGGTGRAFVGTTKPDIVMAEGKNSAAQRIPVEDMVLVQHRCMGLGTLPPIQASLRETNRNRP
jgi:hypothetical protein